MSYIADYLKNKYLKNIKTTNDLIYKDQIIDPHNIVKAYDQKVAEKKYIKSSLKFGDYNYYYNDTFSELLKICDVHTKLSNHYPEPNLRSFLVAEIQNSLWIEGVKSSKKQIKQFLKTEVSQSDYNEHKSKIITNFNEALHFVLSTKSINENLIFTLYNILTKDINMKDEKLDGFPYRQGEVQIGNLNDLGLNASKIKDSMDVLIKFINQSQGTNTNYFLNALLIHLNFEHIHPYYDMNGRMGRLLSIWYLNNFNMVQHIHYFSEAINFYKKEFYYSAFNQVKEKNFKFDATYFLGSMLTMLTSHKIAFATFIKIHNDVKSKYNIVFNGLEKDIIMSLLTKKENSFYLKEDLILGVKEVNNALISKAFTRLVNSEVILETNSKPKEYSLNWSKYKPYVDGIVSWAETK